MVINEFSLKALTGFYENELVNNFLSFWLPRCEDKENGGFLNCFDNKGEHLVSKNKYCWSQGRFVWIFSKLASTEAPIFSDAQRAEFLRLAKNGADFLEAHALIPGRNICSFLLDEKGNPILADGADRLDMSIYAISSRSAPSTRMGFPFSSSRKEHISLPGMSACASRKSAPFLASLRNSARCASEKMGASVEASFEKIQTKRP